MFIYLLMLAFVVSNSLVIRTRGITLRNLLIAKEQGSLRFNAVCHVYVPQLLDPYLTDFRSGFELLFICAGQTEKRLAHLPKEAYIV
ncbi:MAG: hypothetical protein A2511_16225 [Deltaproteobacteria bacterium RIFOXYD12_FULL_50_9]|nr:MAG: hypothetical protein A2511_16225 [Deltaproteobacteria bacterium RIFOXYD12_FULL_50_9]